MNFVFDQVENFMGKGENAGKEHCLLFPPQFFRRISPQGMAKTRDSIVNGYRKITPERYLFSLLIFNISCFVSMYLLPRLGGSVVSVLD